MCTYIHYPAKVPLQCSHTPPQRLTSCITAHTFFVASINTTNKRLNHVFMIMSTQRGCSSVVHRSFTAYSSLKVFAEELSDAELHVTDKLTGLTQYPHSLCLLYPGVLRMVLCHDVTLLCLPLS